MKEFPDFVKDNPEVEFPFGGVRGWLIQGEGRQTVFVEFLEDVDVPEHTHGDQWEFAVAGRVELHREGATELIEAGDNFFVPAGQPHSATVYRGYKAMMVFADPDRYRVKGG